MLEKKTVIFGQKEAENMKRRYELDAKMQRKQKQKKPELKPCPFCGAPAELKEISGRWTVKCTKECAGTRIFNDKHKPIEVWNRRI